jgi:hypothetical protein
MTRQEAIAIATSKHEALNKALRAFWQGGDNVSPPKESDFDYHHGWIKVGEYNIAPDEYAPGPTYDID